MARDISSIFEDAFFRAPEGILTARPQRVVEEDDCRLGVLLWFYNEAGDPVEANLTVMIDAEGADDSDYRERVLSDVQAWLAGIREGEPMIDATV